MFERIKLCSRPAPQGPSVQRLHVQNVNLRAVVEQRAEHHDGPLSSLEEIALHQLNIERIDVLGQTCRRLKILYLQNNLISTIGRLHQLKVPDHQTIVSLQHLAMELEYLNLALNNIKRVQNLQRCESLQKLDLTMNFVDVPGLLSLPSLTANCLLQELFLTGNPCTEWLGYRQFLVATLPRLQKLDGQDIKPSERIAALQALPQLQEHLWKDVLALGKNPAEMAQVVDDSAGPGEEDPEETGHMGPDGDMVRPWCPETRILEHRATERASRAAELCRSTGTWHDGGNRARLHEDFPEVEAEDESAVRLEVEVGKFLDTSLIKADVQPQFVRLLIKVVKYVGLMAYD